MQTKYFKIEALINDEEKTLFVEALRFSKKRIKAIFKEVHPEWNIKRVKSIDSLPTKKGKKQNG